MIVPENLDPEIHSAIFGRDVLEARAIASRILDLVSGNGETGEKQWRPILIACEHGQQRLAIERFLSHRTRRTPYRVRDSAGERLQEVIAAAHSEREQGLLFLNGLELSRWRRWLLTDQFEALHDDFQALEESYANPVFVWLSIKTTERLRSIEPLFRFEIHQFPSDGAMWAEDAASALCLVEERVFSQSRQWKKDQAEWLNRRITLLKRQDRYWEMALAKQELALVNHSLGILPLDAYDEAIAWLQNLKSSYRQKASRELAKTQYYKGSLLRGAGKLHEALECYHIGLSEAKASGCPDTIYYLDHQIKARDPSISRANKLNYFERRAAKFARRGNACEEGHMRYHIGVVHHDMGDHDPAIEEYKRCRELLPIWNRAWYADVTHQIGSAYLDKGDEKEAKEYLEESLDVMQEIDLTIGQLVAHRSLAAAYHNEVEYKHHRKEAFRLTRELGLSTDDYPELNSASAASADYPTMELAVHHAASEGYSLPQRTIALGPSLQASRLNEDVDSSGVAEAGPGPSPLLHQSASRGAAVECDGDATGKADAALNHKVVATPRAGPASTDDNHIHLRIHCELHLIKLSYDGEKNVLVIDDPDAYRVFLKFCVRVAEEFHGFTVPKDELRRLLVQQEGKSEQQLEQSLRSVISSKLNAKLRAFWPGGPHAWIVARKKIGYKLHQRLHPPTVWTFVKGKGIPKKDQSVDALCDTDTGELIKSLDLINQASGRT